MNVDVFSMTQGGKRTISFMSQALGLMADVDIGTENLRWMGDTRFVVGLVRGGVLTKPWLRTPCSTFYSNKFQTMSCPDILQSRGNGQDQNG